MIDTAISRSLSLIGERLSCQSRWLCRLSPEEVRAVKSQSSSSLAGRLLGAGLVDVFPGGIHRQLAGNPLAPLVGFVEAVGGALAVVGAAVVSAEAGARLVFRQRVIAVEVVAVFLAFEHRVGVEGFLDFLLQVEGRQLQQANGLLQLRSGPASSLLADLED